MPPVSDEQLWACPFCDAQPWTNGGWGPQSLLDHLVWQHGNERLRAQTLYIFSDTGGLTRVLCWCRRSFFRCDWAEHITGRGGASAHVNEILLLGLEWMARR